MPCCSKTQCFLYTVHLATSALGAASIAGGVALLRLSHGSIGHVADNLDMADNQGELTHALHSGGAVAVATGVALILMGVLGSVATAKYDKAWAKFVLAIYSLLAMGAFLAAAIGSGGEFAMSHKIQTYGDATDVSSSSFDAPLYHELSKFANHTYGECCHAPPMNATGMPPHHPPMEDSDKPAPPAGQEDKYYNPKDNENRRLRGDEEEDRDEDEDNKGPRDPRKHGICRAVLKRQTDQAAVCADEAAFQAAFMKFLARSVRSVAIGSAVAAALLGAECVALCALVCRRRREVVQGQLVNGEDRNASSCCCRRSQPQYYNADNTFYKGQAVGPSDGASAVRLV